jgi:hypothetical protein
MNDSTLLEDLDKLVVIMTPAVILSPTTTPKIQDSFYLQLALEAKVQYSFGIFSNNMIQKRIFSANEFLGERILIFRLCLSDNSKNVSRIDSLLEVNFGYLTTHFGFGCPYGSLVGDSLSIEPTTKALIPCC